MSLVNDYFEDTNKTYWKTWEVKDEQFPNGTVHWILFIKEDDWNPPYYYGMEPTALKAEQEIKFAIGSYLRSLDLL